MYWDIIYALAIRQRGLVTTAQILDAGATVGWLRWAVCEGRLKRVRQGVYVVMGSVSGHQGLMAACLAGGPSAAASHLASAAVWGAEQVKPGRIEITTFDGDPHRLPGVVSHCSRLDATAAMTRHLAIPIVVPALTVVQVAETCHPVLVERIANDLVKRNWTNFRAILQWVEVVGDRRRQPLRELCLRAIEVGGHDNSPPARTLGHKMLRAGVEPFEVDYPVETPDGLLFIDFAWRRHRLGLEDNGSRDHDSPLAIAPTPAGATGWCPWAGECSTPTGA